MPRYSRNNPYTENKPPMIIRNVLLRFSSTFHLGPKNSKTATPRMMIAMVISFVIRIRLTVRRCLSLNSCCIIQIGPVTLCQVPPVGAAPVHMQGRQYTQLFYSSLLMKVTGK